MKNAEWTENSLGEMLTFQRGFDITKKEQKDGPYPVFSSSGPNSTHSVSKVRGPGVIIGRKGTLGTVFFSGGDFWPHDTTLWVKDFHGNDPHYSYYFLQTLNLAKYDCGASNPTLNRNHIHNLLIWKPPLHVQKRIADILCTYDDLIENNTRRTKILEQMAQMLYREWFVNFRFPGHEKVRMVDSELGQIPQGWALKKLGEVLSLEYGKALKAEQRSGGVVPVFGSSGVVGYHSERLAHGPGIVVGRKGNVGSVFFCDCDFWVIDTAYYVSTSLPLHFVYFNLLTQNFLNNDAAVPGLNRNQAHSLPAVIPDANTLQTFQNRVEPMFKLKTYLEKINSNLRTTRDLLLPKLVSGEISVEQIESEVPAQTV